MLTNHGADPLHLTNLSFPFGDPADLPGGVVSLGVVLPWRALTARLTSVLSDRPTGSGQRRADSGRSQSQLTQQEITGGPAGLYPPPAFHPGEVQCSITAPHPPSTVSQHGMGSQSPQWIKQITTMGNLERQRQSELLISAEAFASA